tara:strand:- start:921 stop:1094 length:174 start_codon:yes stop_codon:yes gene_type:complete
MITWIVYIAVGLILFFILYLAIQGINRGLKAKNINKSNELKFKSRSSSNTNNDKKKI